LGGSAIASISPYPYIRSTQIIASVANVLVSRQVKFSLHSIKLHVQVSLLSYLFDQILSILPASSRIHSTKSHNLWEAFTIKLMFCYSIGALTNAFIDYWAPDDIFYHYPELNGPTSFLTTSRLFGDISSRRLLAVPLLISNLAQRI